MLPAEGIHASAPPRDPLWKERWPNFSPKELACPCCGQYFHDNNFMDKLSALRYIIGKPFKINSGHRCAKHNKAVGGALRSQHLRIAVDIAINGHDRFLLTETAKSYGFTIGYGSTFIHLDLRPRQTHWYYPGSEEFWKKP